MLPLLHALQVYFVFMQCHLDLAEQIAIGRGAITRRQEFVRHLLIDDVGRNISGRDRRLGAQITVGTQSGKAKTVVIRQRRLQMID